MIHTALNTLKNLSANRAVRAQNMSNLNVPGHRKDLNTNFTSGFLHQVNQYDLTYHLISLSKTPPAQQQLWLISLI